MICAFWVRFAGPPCGFCDMCAYIYGGPRHYYEIVADDCTEGDGSDCSDQDFDPTDYGEQSPIAHGGASIAGSGSDGDGHGRGASVVGNGSGGGGGGGGCGAPVAGSNGDGCGRCRGASIVGSSSDGGGGGSCGAPVAHGNGAPIANDSRRRDGDGRGGGALIAAEGHLTEEELIAMIE